MKALRIGSGVVTGMVGLWMLSIAIQSFGTYIGPGHHAWPSPYLPLGIAITLVFGAGACVTAVLALDHRPIRTWGQRLAVVIGLVAVAFAVWVVLVLTFARPQI